MTEVLFDARWIGNHGIGRFAGEVKRLLPQLVDFQSDRRPWHPMDPALLGMELWQKRPKLFFSPGYNSPIGWPKPFVFTLHDLNHLCVRDNSNALKRGYYKYVIRPACHRAAFVLTVSEYSKREISAWAELREEKIINVGNGVGLPFTAAGPKYEPGYPYLLYVGSRKPHKNLPRLLEAYARSGVHRDARLLLSGSLDQQLSAIVNRLGLKEDVGFIDVDTNGDLSDVYRGALAFVFPSLYEGFGLPPLEAMASGIPVLTSNLCSLPEVVGDAGLLVDPLDVGSIADGMRRLIQDSDLRAKLRERSLLRAKEFTWDKTASRIREALEMAVTVN